MLGRFEKITLIGAVLSVLLLALALLAGTALAQTAPPETPADPLAQLGLTNVMIGSAHYSIDWSVVATGGGDISSPHFRLSSTLGQPTTGMKSSSHFETCSGFWCGLDFMKELFLPLLLRDQ
jgi:hypothetical protein